MSGRRKLEPIRTNTLEKVMMEEPPEWNDTLRGILLALMEQRHQMWDSRFRSTKDKVIHQCEEIAAILSETDKRMNEWAVLEKWCWMLEMLVRCGDLTWKWRYCSAMSFIAGYEGNGSQFLCCLSTERFKELTDKYSQQEKEPTISAVEIPKKYRKLETGLFQTEMRMYAAGQNARALTSVSNGNLGKIDGVNMAATLALMSNTPGTNENESQGNQRRTRSKIMKEESVDPPPLKSSDTSSQEKCSSTPGQSSKIFENKPNITSSTTRKRQLNEQSRNSPTLWTDEMFTVLIDGIRLRSALWHHAHPHSKNGNRRQVLFNEITTLMRKIDGAEHVTYQEVVEMWQHLREKFHKIHEQSKEQPVQWNLYEKLMFLSPQVMMACRFDAEGGPPSTSTAIEQASTSSTSTPVTQSEEIQNQVLNNLLSMLPNSSKGQPPAKKARVSTTLPQERNTKSPQIVATWVPPKEDAMKQEQAILSAISQLPQQIPSTSAPTATAQVMATSNISSFLFDAARLNNRNNGYLQSNGSLQSDTTINRSQSIREDKWNLLGRLIEQTCRELEQKNPSLAVMLQKDLSDLVCDYQLKMLNNK